MLVLHIVVIYTNVNLDVDIISIISKVYLIFC